MDKIKNILSSIGNKLYFKFQKSHRTNWALAVLAILQYLLGILSIAILIFKFNEFKDITILIVPIIFTYVFDTLYVITPNKYKDINNPREEKIIKYFNMLYTLIIVSIYFIKDGNRLLGYTVLVVTTVITIFAGSYTTIKDSKANKQIDTDK